jgi:hypothetical protein
MKKVAATLPTSKADAAPRAVPDHHAGGGGPGSGSAGECAPSVEEFAGSRR